MAGGQERVLKRRIKSVLGTKKITRAMELIAASRIVKAQARLLAARPYAEKITEVLRNLQAGGATASHPLLRMPESIRNVAYVVVTGDRGLAGGYNASIMRLAENAVKLDRAQGRGSILIVVGRKGVAALNYRGHQIAAKYIGFTDNPRYENAKEIAQDAASRFELGEVDEVNLIYTEFLSVGSQRAVIRKFAPLEDAAIGADLTKHSLDSNVGSEMRGAAADGHTASTTAAGPVDATYEYEPSPSEILDRLIPRYVEARLYAVLLEAAASEHAARQRAMKSATDNAEELATLLTRQMNRARQEAITTEIMEIIGGAEALGGTGDDMFGEDLGLVEADRERIARNVIHQLH